MNAPADDDDDLRYAEYVLGVLDANARETVTREIQSSDKAAAAVAGWQRRLIPLIHEIAGVTPLPHVWARIQQALQWGSPIVRPRIGVWNNLWLWRWISIGTSVIAATCLTMLVIQSRPAPPPPANASYLVSALQQEKGAAGWTVTVDIQHSRMIVVPADPATLEQGHAPELWLIPAGQKAIAAGMIARNKPTTLTLDAALLVRLGSTALLAVSVEPIGGSPTGQPTGTVIAKGVIRAAPT